MLVAMLAPVATLGFDRDTEDEAWDTALAALWTKALQWSKKAKHVPVTYPLLTALVCAGSHPFFQRRFLPLLDLLLPKIRGNKDHRLIALQCMLHLLGAHLHHQCGSQVTSPRWASIALSLS